MGALAGLGVEYIQYFVTEVLKSSGRRSMEEADFWAHCIGAAAAAGCWGLGQLGYWARTRNRRAELAGIQSFLIFMLVIFAGFWSIALFNAYREVITTPSPWICASDMVFTDMPKLKNGKPRPLYLPGATNNEWAAQHASTFTVSPSPQRIQSCWHTISIFKNTEQKKLRILPKIARSPQGLVNRHFFGLPYTPLAYVEGVPLRLLRIQQTDTLWILDVRDIIPLRKESLHQFKEQLAILKTRGPVVFALPAWADKLHIHKQRLFHEFPEIPIICTPAWFPSPAGLVTVLTLPLQKPKAPYPPIRVISSDPLFRKAFKKGFPKQFSEYSDIDSALSH